MKETIGKWFTVNNGNQVDIHAHVIEDQGPREIAILTNITKPKHCHCSVQKGHWSEFCKSPVTHLWICVDPNGQREYSGSCSRHANQVTWLPDWQQIIKL